MKLTFGTLKGIASSAVCLVAAVTLLQTSQSTVLAAVNTIADGNSSISFDPTSASGINNWSVSGCNQLNQESFYYRLGGSGPALGISTSGAPTVSQPANSLTTTYANSGVSIQIVYTLTGGSAGSFNSSLGVQFSIGNTSGSTLSFYNYGDFNLGGSANTVTMGKNIPGQFNEAHVAGANGASSETTFSRGATAGEAALFNSTLTKLAAGTALSGAASAGPGEATWALQWDFGTGTSTTFSSVTDLQSVPDAPSQVVTWMALGALLLMARFIPRIEYRLARA